MRRWTRMLALLLAVGLAGCAAPTGEPSGGSAPPGDRSSGATSADPATQDGSTTQARSEEGMIVLSNDRIRIGFSKDSGVIGELTDVGRGTAFLAAPGKTPFRITIAGTEYEAFSHFSYARDKEFRGGQAYELRWDVIEGVTLVGRIALRDGADAVEFTSRVENASDQAVFTAEYPIVGGVASLGKDSALAHSYATGLLIHDPHRNFAGEMEGMRYMPYPESFSGASMQFFTYYAPQVGGLYVAAYDGEAHNKWLNIYKKDKNLEISRMYGMEDVTPGNQPSADYPFVLQLVSGDDGWYEAADRYRAWAAEQSWCARGPAQERDASAKPQWLLEDVGLTTFGISPRFDRTAWIERYHRDVGTNVFHVLGPDWAKVDQNFYNSLPGGMDDWFPTRFEKANLDLIRAQGDRVAPFEFDFLLDPNKSDGAAIKKNLQIFPSPTLSHDGYTFNMLCPTTEYTQDFHAQRDLRVYEEAKVDGMYYDISANNLIKIDMSAEHGHKPGGGAEITKGYQRTYDRTRSVISEAAGTYFPLGTEMINEVFLNELDYYQARAWAQPCSELETWPFHALMKTGQAEMIPMFTYVYNEYGIVRMDGWGKLTEEIGELFYHSAAKIYAWGGLYELNYEYSPMEKLDGVEPPPEEHYWQFKPRGFEYSTDRAAYLKQFAALRTGAGNRFLAYGTMQRPLAIDSTRKSLKWFMYNHAKDERGSIEVDTIVQGAWKSVRDGKASLGFVIANIDDKAQPLRASIDLAAYGLASPATARVLTGFDGAQPTETALTVSEGMVDVSMNLAGRTVYLIEVDE